MTTTMQRLSGTVAFAVCALVVLALCLLRPADVRGQQWTTPDASQNINNTNTGNVGVGTSTPAAKLAVAGVNGPTNATMGAAPVALHVIGGVGGNGNWDASPGGVGGAISLSGGTGGEPVANYTTALGGKGGSISLTGGTGGPNTFNRGGGAGGDVLINGGAGVANSNGNVVLGNLGGNVGIGTLTPTNKLEVLATDGEAMRLYRNAANAGWGVNLKFAFNNSSGAKVDYAGLHGISASTTAAAEAGDLIFTTATGGSLTEKVRVSSTGNVGIGTISPAKKLHVNGSNSQVMVDRWANTAGNYALVNFATNGVPKFFFGMNADSDPNVDKLSFFDSAFSPVVPVMTFTGGKIGVGTVAPNPAYKLDVNGHTNVTGNLNATGTITGGTIHAQYQDVAEWVESSQSLPAGTVEVLDHTKSNQVVASTEAYDTRVAGVISAQPGITLGESGAAKVLVATTGRVKIKVDATSAPIQVGDLLVTGEREGFAMKSLPVSIGGVQLHRPGTLVGKALEPLARGTGEILVLLSLQ